MLVNAQILPRYLFSSNVHSVTCFVLNCLLLDLVQLSTPFQLCFNYRIACLNFITLIILFQSIWTLMISFLFSCAVNRPIKEPAIYQLQPRNTPETTTRTAKDLNLLHRISAKIIRDCSLTMEVLIGRVNLTEGGAAGLQITLVISPLQMTHMAGDLLPHQTRSTRYLV